MPGVDVTEYGDDQQGGHRCPFRRLAATEGSDDDLLRQGSWMDLGSMSRLRLNPTSGLGQSLQDLGNDPLVISSLV